MKRQKLVEHARNQIDQLKKAGVPKLMQQKNTEALEKILESFDYSTYEEYRAPEFNSEELTIDSEEDIYATVFYVWGNPYVIAGDIGFFYGINDLRNLLIHAQDSYLSKTVYNLLYKNGYNLSKYAKPKLTLGQLLGIEKLKRN